MELASRVRTDEPTSLCPWLLMFPFYTCIRSWMGRIMFGLHFRVNQPILPFFTDTWIRTLHTLPYFAVQFWFRKIHTKCILSMHFSAVFFFKKEWTYDWIHMKVILTGKRLIFQSLIERRSRQASKTKQVWMWLVPGWETIWNLMCSLFFNHYLFHLWTLPMTHPKAIYNTIKTCGAIACIKHTGTVTCIKLLL